MLDKISMLDLININKYTRILYIILKIRRYCFVFSFHSEIFSTRDLSSEPQF